MSSRMPGRARCRAEHGRLEQLLNDLTNDGIPLSEVRFSDDAACFTIPCAHEAAAQRAAERNHCQLVVLHRSGMPSLLTMLKRRIALVVGLVLFLSVLGVFSMTVLTISVEGNEAIADDTILSQLHDMGLKRGRISLMLSEGLLAQELLIRMPDLTWCAINFHGTHAEVLVREELVKPELLDETIFGDIISDASGIIESVDTLSGKAAILEGSTVSVGDMLIAGTFQMQFPQYSEFEGSAFHVVRAMGEVTARTWRSISASLPLTYEHKVYNGEEKSRLALLTPTSRMNFYRNSGISDATYDKITDVYALDWLPFSLVKETLRAYEIEQRSIHREHGEVMLKEQLLASLETTVMTRGEVLSVSYESYEENGLLVVTITGECREKIGVFVPYD